MNQVSNCLGKRRDLSVHPESQVVNVVLHRTGLHFEQGLLFRHKPACLGGYCRLATALFLWLPALIIRKTSDKDSLENRHAKSALNYHLSTVVFVLGSLVVLGLIGLLVSLAGGGTALILIIPIAGFGILTIGGIALRSYISGSIAGARGKEYSYPITYAFVK
ncbi:MAG: DUF4870 domain-containing protein [Microbacteriaceae bacterium]|nr:DUF4870 domain-containing protein [Microbacteriaceae bacterium]